MNTKKDLPIYILLVSLYTLAFWGLAFLLNPLVFGESSNERQAYLIKKTVFLSKSTVENKSKDLTYATSRSFHLVQGLCKRVLGPFVTQFRAHQISSYYIHQGYRTSVTGSVLRGEYYVHVFYPNIFCKY